MLQYDFHSSLGFWVCVASRLYERQMNQRLAPQGITNRQGQVLGWLALEGELSQVDLADRMNIEPPTLVRVLDRMERDGWIAREACQGDRRKKMIRPLPKSEAIWKKITSSSEDVRAQATEGLTDAQQEMLKSLLRTVVESLASEECLNKMRLREENRTKTNSTKTKGRTARASRSPQRRTKKASS